MDEIMARVARALASDDSAVRLRAALAVGTSPDPGFIDLIVQRCAVEPDFFVRDMLTWALTRHSPALTVPRLLDEVRGLRSQGRSQALHTLSKIGDPRAWSAITPALLADADDEVARAAWRVAVLLVPEAEKAWLAEVLATQLGRGGPPTQRSLSRALAALGEAAEPLVRAAMTSPDDDVRRHAFATDRLLRDPEAGFAVDEAKRLRALGGRDPLTAAE